MKLLDRILVLVDQSSADETLIQYVNAIAERTPVEKIYFLNIIRSFVQLPEEIKKEFPDLEKKAIKEREEKINAFVNENYKFSDKVKPEVFVRTGSSLKNIIGLCDDLDISVVFVGRKIKKEEGVLPQRLARRLPCSLMVIPENSFERFDNRDNNRILVPIDFSPPSKLALRHAIALGDYAEKETEIVAQHVVTVPSGYHYTGKTHKEFAEVLKENAKKKYKVYVEDVDFKGQKVTPIFTVNKDDKVYTIYKTAEELDVNLIYFASKGRSGATAYFMGSTAEKLLKVDSKFPLVVLRRKNEFKSILDSLMEI